MTELNSEIKTTEKPPREWIRIAQNEEGIVRATDKRAARAKHFRNFRKESVPRARIEGLDIRYGEEKNTGESKKTWQRPMDREQRMPLRPVETAMEKPKFSQNAKSKDDNGSKLTRKSRRAKYNEREPPGNMIRVTPIPSGKTTSDIIQLFEKYGGIKTCTLDRNVAIVRFKKKGPVNIVLENPPAMDGQKLQINRATWKKRLPAPRTNQQVQKQSEKSVCDIILNELKTKLISQTTFEKELEIFLETIQLNEDEIEKNWQSIHASLLEALKPSFPNCVINQFGSTVTGLCFKGSDIDIYLDIGETINENEKQNIGWTPRRIFNEVKNLFQKRQSIFQQMIPISRARVPIIKFLHSPTSTNCDINFKNGHGFINSQLIKRLLSFDARLKPLMMIIKFLVKTSELSVPGKITHYAMVMMIIFYLQQPETRLLPTIEELQRTCEPIYQWNWQVNFDRDSKFPASTNENSVSELLAGFFKFYEKFPFSQNVIRPLTGLAQSKEDFTKMCIEQGEEASYMDLLTPMCLQDPIRLDENIVKNVSTETFENFQKFCAIGAQICDNSQGMKEKPFLLNLLTSFQVLRENKIFRDITIYARKTLEAGLPTDFNARTDIENREEFIKNHWYTLAQKIVEDVLTRVLKVNVRMAQKDSEEEQKDIGEPSDVNAEVSKKIVLECTVVYYPVKKPIEYRSSKHRPKKNSINGPTVGNIDRHILLFEKEIEKLMNKGVKPTNINFTFIIQRERNPVCLLIRLKNRNDENEAFNHFKRVCCTTLGFIVHKELARIRKAQDEENKKVI